MPLKRDDETLKIPAYMRKKAIVSQSKQQLIMTALDRKDAGLKANSKRATARKKTISKTPRRITASARRERAASEEVEFPSPLENQEVLPQPRTYTPAEIRTNPKKMMLAGETTHYLDKINVAIIMMSRAVKVGDTLLIEGEECIFAQQIDEMQIDRKPVKRAKKGAHIGLKTTFEAKINGKVYKV